MSRLEVPLGFRTLRATGDTVLWADLVLSLKTNRDVWKEIPFRVDPGTEMTTMPAPEARNWICRSQNTRCRACSCMARRYVPACSGTGSRHGSDRIRLPLLLPWRPEPPAAHAGEEPFGIDRCHQPDPPQLRRHDIRACTVGSTGGGEAIAARCVVRSSTEGGT